MARIRSIKPEFWTDEKIVELSAFARLLFIGLWNFADDSGRMIYSPKRTKMQIFPADDVNILELFGEIRRERLIDVYVVDSVEYLQIKNFELHQKIDKRTASKLPVPPTSPELPRTPPTDQGRDQGKEGNGKDQGIVDASASTFDAPPEEPDFKIIGEMACELAGIDPAKTAVDFGQVIGWIAAGFHPDDDISPTIRRIAAKPSYRPPKSLAYFTPAIRDAHNERTREPPGNGGKPRVNPLDAVT